MNTDYQKKLSPRGFPQACVTVCRWQKAALILLVLLLILGALLDWRREVLWLNAAMTVFYTASMLYRLLTVLLALKRNPEIKIDSGGFSAPPPGMDQWPRYLVLLPMYHESAVLPELVDGLSRMDYPADRLEIRLLIEEDDSETREAAEAMNLPPQFRITLIPESLPRTKPKACNVGIADAEADFLVIYDAEDRPEKDQLKKAALAFSQVPDNVVCIQAKLGYYNADQNLLTRCFAVEYATWFGLCLPGLDCLQAPIPLGGTSNHFRFQALKKVGAWDEFNVTEDCDLGLRLFIDGSRTRILESSTWEQACPRIRAWIRQRSRWVKGYIQTYLVHTRDFTGLHRKLGFRNSFQFHLLIGGSFFTQLINPLYWLLTLCWIIFHPAGVSYFYPRPVFVLGTICLFIGNFIFIYTGCIACLRRNLARLIPCSILLMPFYWLLMSVGAWKGFLQLFTRPSHWEKTPHFTGIADSASSAVRENSHD